VCVDLYEKHMIWCDNYRMQYYLALGDPLQYYKVSQCNFKCLVIPEITVYYRILLFLEQVD